MNRFCWMIVWILSSATVAYAEDWPQFRGPKADGHYQGRSLPTVWGPDKNVVWKQAIPGRGWSSPIYWKDKLYLTTSIPEKEGDLASAQKLMALCLHASDGKILWDKLLFEQVADPKIEIHKKNSHASPTPITDGERIYFHFGPQGTAATDLDGKVVWQRTDIRFATQHGNGGSPILVDNLLVFHCDGRDQQFVIALDKKTGDEVWRTQRKVQARLGFSFATPALIKTPKGKQIVSMASNITAGYEPKTGRELWRYTYVGWSLIQQPIYGHGLVFFTTGYTSPKLFAVNPDERGDLTEKAAWSIKQKVPNTPSLLLVGEELYMFSDSGTATCMNAKTGEIYWQERLKGAYSASPIYSDGKIYITSEEGFGYVLAAGKEFKQIAFNDMKEPTFATFVPVDGALYIRTEKHLYRFEQLAQ